jgi:ketosteroid isomerase-like protein
MSQEIEQILKDRATAVRTKDIEKAATFYKDDLRVFDLVNPLERHGKAGVVERLKEWFSSFDDIQDYYFNGLQIHISGNIAVCSLFNHVKAVKPDKSLLDMWWRETLGMEKLSDTWLIIHTHSSVPFDPKNGMASMGLKPTDV